ncbi:MAG TPA: response regulator transcription factor [Anaerolineae bacterium]|nr:response regulator transcription factor [Anaerolineae bacterium]HPL27992.1 response regulator transcription factor [Anaerolineae bacterium]
MPNEVITVLIADDTLIAREGLKSILEGVRGIQVIGEASSAQEAVQMAQERRPDVVLMDLLWHGDETAGAEATRQITRSVPETKVLLVTVYPQLIAKAREAGATAALEKGFSKDDLINLIRHVHRTQQFTVARFGEDVANTLGLPPQEALTPREEQVLQLLVEGKSVREIALELGIAPSTVKNHVQSIYGKLQVSNRAEAVRKAMRAGIVR